MRRVPIIGLVLALTGVVLAGGELAVAQNSAPSAAPEPKEVDQPDAPPGSEEPATSLFAAITISDPLDVIWERLVVANVVKADSLYTFDKPSPVHDGPNTVYVKDLFYWANEAVFQPDEPMQIPLAAVTGNPEMSVVLRQPMFVAPGGEDKSIKAFSISVDSERRWLCMIVVARDATDEGGISGRIYQDLEAKYGEPALMATKGQPPTVTWGEWRNSEFVLTYCPAPPPQKEPGLVLMRYFNMPAVLEAAVKIWKEKQSADAPASSPEQKDSSLF